jgi:OTU domain-containing protein 6
VSIRDVEDKSVLIMEDLLAKHRKEKRDLQAKTAQKKKAATKKTRKGVNEECDRLETQLRERQAQELAELDGVDSSEGKDLDGVGAAEADPGHAAVEEKSPENGLNGDEELSSQVSKLEVSDTSSPSTGKKPNRQKARLARRAAEQARVTEEAEAEAVDLPNLREREKEIMTKTFKSHGLQEKEIRPDGHCLYAAIADQVKVHGRTVTVGNVLSQGDDFRTVRHVAANHISNHSEDFVPFLEEDLDTYVRKVRDTGEWGGQIELKALAEAYKLKICIVQGDGRITEIGDDKDTTKIWLAYYRHGFGLGEHYNSLRQDNSTIPS